MQRRQFIHTALAASGAAASAGAAPPVPPRDKRLGLTIWSYGNRWRLRKRDEPAPPWRDALDVLDRCKELGAGSLQIGVRGWTEDFIGKVRDRREAHGILLEGQVGLPKKERDLTRFETDIRAAKEAGAKTVRAVCLGGRRYETFQSLDAWKSFVRESRAALERAEPVLAKHKMELAVENHKDWRADEHLELLKQLESEWIGVNFDFGNNYALLEDPHLAAEALAPYIMTTHVKDMALARSENGFLLSEVPLGKGVLDLPRIMALCEQRNANVQFNLEMITRDPLRVPVLEDKYWETMAKLPAPDLAETLRLAGEGDADALPSVAGMDEKAKLDFEDANVRSSFAFAKESLGLG